MAYDNPGSMESETMSEGMHEEGGEAMVDVTSLIPPDMDVKDGEVLEFRVHKGEDGKVMAEYNYGDKGEKEEGWDDGFRKFMSPRNGETGEGSAM